jgi:hypothetical protein
MGMAEPLPGPHNRGNSVMTRPRRKRSPLEAEVAEEIRVARNREQDEVFRRALHDAIYAGTESCPLNGYHRPD